MRWLKYIVILLGMLIVCSVGLLGYGFFKKSTQPDWNLFSTSEQPQPPSRPMNRLDEYSNPLPAFGELNLKTNPGCFIKSTRPDGKRLYIILGPKETCSKVIIIDVTDGRTLGTVSVGR